MGIAGNRTVFISYAREDYDSAKRLYNDLKAAGLEPWLDKENITAGQDWKEVIMDAIENCRYFIPLFSSTSVTKISYIQSEYVFALEYAENYPSGTIFAIPVKLDDCKIPIRKLRMKQHVDLFPHWGTGIKKILQAIGIKDKHTSVKKNHKEDLAVNKQEKEQKASILLEKILVSIAHSLGHFDEKIKIKNLDERQIKKEITKIVENGNFDHYFIYAFANKISKQIQHINTNEQKEVVKRFVIPFFVCLEYLLDSDGSNIDCNKTFQIIQQRISNLEECDELFNKNQGIDKKALKDYYIDNNATDFQNLNLGAWKRFDDGYVLDNDYNKYQKCEDLIKQSLKDFPNVLLVAPFGIGKTSACLKIASSYANGYLSINNPDPIFPIYISLKNFNTIDQTIEKICRKLNSLFPYSLSKKTRLLLICDGLDNFKNYRKEFIDKLREETNGYVNLEIIVTSRPEEIPTVTHDEFNRKYKKLRLLPFNRYQIIKFFEKYNPHNSEYTEIVSKLNYEVTRQPLFCWILANSYSSNENKDLLNILKRRENPYVLSSFMYGRFLYKIFNGSFRSQPNDDIAKYNFEKKILRKISALRMIYGKNLDKHKVIDGLNKIYGIDVTNEINNDLHPQVYSIINSYFLTNGGGYIDFTHESIGDYLYAEYCLECILDGKYELLNLGIPSHETISFLGGLIDLFLDRQISNLFDAHDNLFRTIMFSLDPKNTSFDNLKELSFRGLISRNGFLIKSEVLENQYNENNSNNVLKSQSFLSYNDYRIIDYYWLYRWISLYVYNKVTRNAVSSENIFDLIEDIPKFIPFYLKKFKVNLENKNIQQINLAGSALSGSRFVNCDLTGADLSYANLTKVNLTNSKLNQTNLHKAELKGSVITNSSLSNSHMTESKIMNSKLTDTDLSNTDIMGADLSGSEINQSIFFNTTLSGSKLNSAKFNDCIIMGSDLSVTEVTKTKFTGCIISYSDLTDLKDPVSLVIDTSSIVNETNIDSRSLAIDTSSIVNETNNEPKQIDEASSWQNYQNICNRLIKLESVRFTGLCDKEKCQFIISRHKPEKRILLSQKEKIMMLHIAWKGITHRYNLQDKIGKLLYACEKYEKLTRINIPVKDKKYFLFITIENDSKPEEIFNKLDKNILPEYNELITKGDEDYSFDFICKENESAHDFINDKILPLNDRIRTAVICDEFGNIKARTLNGNISPYLTAKESDDSVRIHLKRWNIRKKFAPKIGECKYAYAIYEKIIRMTIPFKNDLLLVTCGKGEKGEDDWRIYEDIIKKIEVQINAINS